MSAVARLKGGALDIWAGNQNPSLVQQVGARIAGLPRDAVLVHSTYMGGGFGRRLETDFIAHAVHAARAMEGTPVKVIWPREQDTTHDVYRPIASARFRGAVKNDRPVAFDLAVSSPSLPASAQRRGEVSALEGKKAEAFETLREAVVLEDKLVYDEPPAWMLPVRHALGALLVASGEFAEAEAVYRKDLQIHRENGWALTGLQQALFGQGKSDEALLLNDRIAAAFADADVSPTSSCYCEPGPAN